MYYADSDVALVYIRTILHDVRVLIPTIHTFYYDGKNDIDLRNKNMCAVDDDIACKQEEIK